MSKSRLDDPVFASSVEVRRVFNDPVQLTKIRLGLSKPGPMDDAIAKITKISALADTGPYFDDVVPMATKLKHIYERLSLDQLKAIIATTLEHPPYYTKKNQCQYDVRPQHTHDGYEDWLDFITHTDEGLETLAAMHRAVAAGEDLLVQPSPPELFRLAWIPQGMWRDHYRVNNTVVFRAPMSTAANLSVSDGFLNVPESKEADHVPCLLVFDGTTARCAAQLGDPRHAISYFGPSEDEWCLPSNLRCVVSTVGPEPNGRKTKRGTPIQRVNLKGVRSIAPAKFVLEMIPLESLLLGAFLVGIGATEAERRAGMPTASTADYQGSAPETPPKADKDVILVTIFDLCEALSTAVHPVDPAKLDAAVRCTTWSETGYYLGFGGGLPSVVADAFFIGGGWAIATGSVALYGLYLSSKLIAANKAVDQERDTKKLRDAHAERLGTIQDRMQDETTTLATKLGLKSVSDDELKRAAKLLDPTPKRLCKNVERCVEHLIADTSIEAWAFLLVAVKYVARIATHEDELAELFEKPNYLKEVQGRTFFEAVSKVGDCLFASAPITREDAAWHSAAWEDILRLKLATTRLAVMMGEADGGKTTFIQEVFGIATEGRAGLSAQGRTPRACFYKHPYHQRQSCEAYVMDTPGYGDEVEERNDIVRVVSTCTTAMPNCCSHYWVLKAQRPLHSVVDDMFKLLAPSCAAIIITRVDERVEELLVDFEEELGEVGFDFNAEDADEKLDVERQKIMQTVKNEVGGHIRNLCRDAPGRNMINEGDRVCCATAMPKGFTGKNPEDIMLDLGIDKNDEGEVMELDVTQGLASVQWDSQRLDRRRAKVELQYLCKVPPILYAVLSQKSWACTEPWKSKGRKPRCPQGWNNAKEDLASFFDLQSASKIFERVNKGLGIA